MFMAAGFAMLESGMVRSKNVATICLKNISLFSIAGLMYWLVGYNLMYGIEEGGYIGSSSLSGLLMTVPLPARHRISQAAMRPVLTGTSKWYFAPQPLPSYPAPLPSA